MSRSFFRGTGTFFPGVCTHNGRRIFEHGLVRCPFGCLTRGFRRRLFPSAPVKSLPLQAAFVRPIVRAYVFGSAASSYLCMIGAALAAGSVLANATTTLCNYVSTRIMPNGGSIKLRDCISSNSSWHTARRSSPFIFEVG